MLRTLSTGLLSAALVLAMALPALATGRYTVQPGDTLNAIATSHGVEGGWPALHAANRATVPDPNRISVGQVLVIPDGAGSASAAPQPAAAPADARGAAVVAAARSQIGAPYRRGGTGPAFDCSGLTQFAWRAAGVEIPRVSRAQHARLNPVAPQDRRPGDIVVYGNPVHHVGIYVGEGRMVHASRPGVPVAEVPVHGYGLRGYVRP